MIEVVNEIEYTYVRTKSEEGVIRGGVLIGNDFVYPPLAKPLPKKTYEDRGVDFTSKSKGSDESADHYDNMVAAHKKSLKWVRVVSVNNRTREDNRGTVEFYKKNGGLEERDGAKVREYYEKKNKDKK